MFNRGDRIKSKVSSSNKITKDQIYYVQSSDYDKILFLDDNKQSMVMTHDRVNRYFDRVAIMPDPDGFTVDLANQRQAKSECTCGAWAVKDSACSSWCDTMVEPPDAPTDDYGTGDVTFQNTLINYHQ